MDEYSYDVGDGSGYGNGDDDGYGGSYGDGSSDGYGRGYYYAGGYGDGYGYGYGTVIGDGCGSMSGNDAGGGDGCGAARGYGYSLGRPGRGYGMGWQARFNPGSIVEIGCKKGSLRYFLRFGKELAQKHGVGSFWLLYKAVIDRYG